MARHLVVGVNGSAPATAAVEWAAADAQRRGLGLRIVHVCEQWRYGDQGTKYCAGTLAAAADRARGLTRDVEVTTEMLPGDVIDALIGESASADSVVLGSRGLGGFARLVVGSVGLGVAGHATGPVVIVRKPSVMQYGRVVVGDDGSDASEAAVQYAADQSRARGVPLHVVFAWKMLIPSPYGAEFSTIVESACEQEIRMAADRMVLWREKNLDVEITGEQVIGDPADVLIQAGGTADLVVVGSRGLGGFASAVLGSVSHAVLHHLTCPVAVVRPRTQKESGAGTVLVDGDQGPPAE